MSEEQSGDPLIANLLQLFVAVTAVTFSLLAQAERADQSLLRVTIAVDGMMKSKSGAT